MSSASPQRPPRIAGLDALRGFSILLVVLHHLALRIPLGKTALAGVVPKPILSALSYNGYEAVFIFFVISGFLITTHSLARWGTLPEIDLRGFYVRRLARIAPSLLALLLLLSALHLAGVPRYVIDKPGQSLGGALLSALGLCLNWYEGRTDWLPGGWDVLWSLSIEEAFYVAFPLVCRWVRPRWLLVLLLLLLALSVPWTRGALADRPIWQEKAYLPGMGAIASGVLCALVLARWQIPERAARLLGLGGVLGLIAVLVFGREVFVAFGQGYMLVLIGAAVLLVASLAAQPQRPGARALAPLRAWGRLSYEIYLTHMFVVFTLVGLFKLSGAHMAWGALWYLPLVAGCWALGHAVARWWSEPCDRWLRRRWLVRPPPPPRPHQC